MAKCVRRAQKRERDKGYLDKDLSKRYNELSTGTYNYKISTEVS